MGRRARIGEGRDPCARAGCLSVCLHVLVLHSAMEAGSSCHPQPCAMQIKASERCWTARATLVSNSGGLSKLQGPRSNFFFLKKATRCELTQLMARISRDARIARNRPQEATCIDKYVRTLIFSMHVRDAT